jgi:hypothetical protein
MLYNEKLTPKTVFIMSKVMFDYTKSVLERVSFNPILFCKELEKAIKALLPYELDQLKEWLLDFTVEKPELKQCLIIVNS